MESKQEKIIVSLTSYKPRFGNLPTVLDTIFAQTIPPDKVVINLALDELLPDDVAEYFDVHNVEIFRVPDTKVYKKLIPTLKRYPDDIVVAIDDDFLYPQGMIEDFIEIHKRFPNNPISGHGAVVFKTMCHCGCASLTMAEFLGDYVDLIDDDLIKACPSDDLVYTYFLVKNGHPYVHTKETYFTNMIPFDNSGVGYSENNPKGIEETYDYLVNNYGRLPNFVESYLGKSMLSEEIYYVHTTICQENEDKLRSTKSFRIGKALTKPFACAKKAFNNKKR